MHRFPTLAATLLLALAASQPLLAGPPPAAPLNAVQQQALRCSAAFALGAEMQARGDPGARGWPPLALRGREFFVRVAAQLIDETGLTREAVAALLANEARDLSASGSLAQTMPPCLVQLAASGL